MTLIPFPRGINVVPRGKDGFGASLVALLLLSTLLFSYFWVETYLNPPLENFNAPATPILFGDSASRPISSLSISPGYNYDIFWKVGKVYQAWGGDISMDIKNTGNTSIYVYAMGFSGDWDGGNITRETSVLIRPGERKWIGVLSFPGPETYTPALYRRYRVGLGFMAGGSNTSAPNSWFDAGFAYHGDRAFLIEPLADFNPVFQSRIRNDLWSKTNSLVDPAQPGVQAITNDLRSKYGGEYNVYHVVGAFEHVWRNVEYELEPLGQDQWQSPGETLILGKGDCEDHAILLASIVTALGGSARMNIISGHAFASVYMGETLDDAMDAWGFVESYYGSSLAPCWIVGDGYWISADTLGGFYLGGLPVNASPVDPAAGTWAFTSTMVLSVIDV